jgi:hypothetical protein
MARDTDVTIIGAGPYGLGLAAHLRDRGVNYRIFGESMRFWRDMPVGVNLKSLAFASNISVPKRGYTYPKWCVQHGLEDYEPCTMQSFAAYGCEMQQQFIPDLEEINVTNVQLLDQGFEITLASGERFSSRKVVVATGLSGMSYVPEVLDGLGPQHMRHTFNISDYSEFRNKTVAVIGAGASAIEAGALVHEAGGSGEVFARCKELVFHGREPRVRPLWKRIKEPTTVLGTSRSGWVLQHFPLMVHKMPLERRTRFVKTHLGPASPWWIQDRLASVPIHMQHELLEASTAGDRVELKFKDGAGHTKSVDVDFVIAGTGYNVDIARLQFLDAEIIRRVQCIEQAPDLNIHFESSVPGLHFLGPLSFMCFGPLFRFVSGAEVASPRLARHLSR